MSLFFICDIMRKCNQCFCLTMSVLSCQNHFTHWKNFSFFVKKIYTNTGLFSWCAYQIKVFVLFVCWAFSMTQGTQIKKTEPHQLKFMSVPMSDSLFHYVIFFLVPSLFCLWCQVWFQYLYLWVPTDTIARKFPIAEQPSLNPRASWVSSHTNQIVFKLKGQHSLYY